MFISSGEEQISLPAENERESLKPSLMGSNPDSLDGFSPVSELHDSPSIPSICTDVNVIPEHEKNELEQLILNLEGSIFNLSLLLHEVIVLILSSSGYFHNVNILHWIGSLGEIAQLRLKHRSFAARRREALNKILDIKGNGLGWLNHGFLFKMVFVFLLM